MFKGLKGIIIGSIIVSILITGGLTSFRFDKVTFFDTPYPPQTPTNLAVEAWLFCISLAILVTVLAALFVTGRKLLFRNRR